MTRMNIKFLQLTEQSSVTHYWGVMRFLGRMAPDTTMYAVDFADAATHYWHYHLQDELIVVVRGSIEQLIGSSPDCVTHKQILRAGEAVQLPSGAWHSAEPLEPGTRVVFTIKGGDGIYRAFEQSGQELVGPADDPDK